MCREYKLARLSGDVSCYPALMVNLIWFANEKCLLSALSDMKSGVLRSKNATILQARCASALSCSNTGKSNYPHRHINAIALHVFVTVTVKLQQFVINEPDFSPLEQGSN